jgi:hypothetical protein
VNLEGAREGWAGLTLIGFEWHVGALASRGKTAEMARFWWTKTPHARLTDMSLLPLTSDALLDAEHRPYFLWWLDCSVGDLRQHLASNDPERKAYYLGALLREANTRDVWQFTTPEQVRALWPNVARHLGPSKARWEWLLGLPPS